MKIFLDCVSCFVTQALDAGRMVTDDEVLQEKILRAVLERARDLSFSESPAYMGGEVHRIVRELSGNDDPYRELKEHFNKLAMETYPDLKEKVRVSKEPFATALRLAIAGNIIDFGMRSKKDDIRLFDTIADTLSRDFAINHIKELREAIDGASRILYLGDNAGETVFDRLLIEEMPMEKITYVVKASPIINDATMEDAAFAGITELVEVIDNGDNSPGTILKNCSAEFRGKFEEADLIISKGQGNYETLNDVDKNIFFLLKAKCPVIAQDIGCQQGEIIVKWGRVR
jgi:uncharacterized protein with ATP-grasp and redox domains